MITEGLINNSSVPIVSITAVNVSEFKDNINNKNLRFIMRLKHAMQTQRRRSLHIGKTND